MIKSLHLVGYFYKDAISFSPETSLSIETVNQKHSLAHGTYGSNNSVKCNYQIVKSRHFHELCYNRVLVNVFTQSFLSAM